MKYSPSQLVEKTKAFVQDRLKNAEGGHDWFHIQRVYNNAMQIASQENGHDVLVVQMAALLHDIADSKFHDGNEEIGPRIALEFMASVGLAQATSQHVVKIIENISFKGGHGEGTFDSLELQIVRDADRLDAMGAIGIARTFNFGGFKNNAIYDPAIPPNPGMDKETYKKANQPTLNHFHEKLLLLKDLMHTTTGRQLAEARHEFMVQYLAQFHAEWNGKR
ncbi:HD domain-containing protein [Nonlabens xiamenensis]|uniref:HD domain-containing protein n=1 Tax=Nonlabens xiamenensis TaxID=2341043 RepID=UPI000F60B9F8|nr:HD domain-containing protein [Nonlabens xiamenensis]